MFRRARFTMLATVLVAGALHMLLAGAARASDVAPDAESRLLSLVNDHRATHGLPPLQAHAGLTATAREQSVAMAAAGAIFHTSSLAAVGNAAVPDWRLLGENVGVGPSVESVFEALLASPRHHDNIDGASFTALGTGVVNEGLVAYVTQQFAQVSAPRVAPAAIPVRPVAVAPAPRRTPVAAKPAPTVAPAAPIPTVTPTPEPAAVSLVRTEFVPVPTSQAPPLQDRDEPGTSVVSGLVAMLERVGSLIASVWR